MIIAIPLNEPARAGGICQSFGRAPYFLIHDAEHKTDLFLENKAAKSRDGAGVRAAQTIVDHDADVLLTPRCGGNAAFILQAAKVSIYQTKEGSIEANLSAFANGDLSKLEEVEDGQRGHGR